MAVKCMDVDIGGGLNSLEAVMLVEDCSAVADSLRQPPSSGRARWPRLEASCNDNLRWIIAVYGKPEINERAATFKAQLKHRPATSVTLVLGLRDLSRSQKPKSSPPSGVLSPSMVLAMFRGPSGCVYSGMGTAVLNAVPVGHAVQKDAVT